MNIPTEHADFLENIKSRFLNKPGITGVSVGYKEKEGKTLGGICVKVYVNRKLKLNDIPEELQVPSNCDVVERSFAIPNPMYGPNGERLIGTYDDIPENRLRQDPIRPGVSVGNYGITAGTLGLFCYNKKGERGILSNFHVLAGHENFEIGDPILQPGAFDGGLVETDVIANLSKIELSGKADSAFAILNGSRNVIPTTVRDRVYFTDVASLDIGDEVEKEGRTTGHTSGFVTAIGEWTINYGAFGYQTIKSYEIRPTMTGQPFGQNVEVSYGGDSGAVWYKKERGRKILACGLNFAGESYYMPRVENALACDIPYIFKAFELSLKNPNMSSYSNNRDTSGSSSSSSSSSS
tara:strand:+ start:44194 stop:45246 length:1053 start_codon:yes stop_codon:yes gene_type:complete